MREGWVETTLSEVLTISRERIDPSRLEPDYELIHWSIPQLDETGGPNNETASEIGSHKFAVLKDSVVYSLLNPRIPRFAKIVGGKRVVCSTEFAVLQPDSSLSLDFLYCFVSSSNFQEQVRSLAKGTTKSRERIDNKEIEKLHFKLPPLPEQKRIVDLISSVDSYIEALQQQLDSAKKSRNAVLHDLFTANDSWPEIGLEDLENSGVIKLGRGDVISKKDMEADPGPNPVYSSAENKNGMIGQYAKFMFDEELITWSIDGGGHIFYRPKHKFSVTNIGGWLRILDDSIFSYKFLTFALQRLHTQHHFDWQSKAHPSVLRTLYTRIPSPPLAEQNRIVGIISAIDEQIKQSNNAVRVARDLRSGLLSDLISGEHEIPADYDKVMGAA